MLLDLKISDIEKGDNMEKLLLEIRNDIKELKEENTNNYENLKREFISFKNNVNTQIRGMDGAIKNNSNSINELQNKQIDIQSSQSFLSDKYDKLIKEIEELKISKYKLQDENKYLNNYLCNVGRLAEESKERINDLNQYIRRIMLEVNGIPQEKEEDLMEILKVLFDKLELSALFNTIDVAHRLSDHPAASIIIKFVTRSARDQFFSARKNLENIKLKDIGFCNEEIHNNSIFINESLTKQNKDLFKKLRTRCKEIGYSFWWTVNGTVFVRKGEKEKAIKISNENDITRYIT